MSASSADVRGRACLRICGVAVWQCGDAAAAMLRYVLRNSCRMRLRTYLPQQWRYGDGTDR
jgi:hypothetical protein